MNLLSIDTKTCQVIAYACTGNNKVKLLAPKFDRVPDAEEVEAMRKNPEGFVYGHCDVEPSVA